MPTSKKPKRRKPTSKPKKGKKIMKKVTFDLDLDLIELIRIEAEKADRSASALLRIIIREWADNLEKKSQK